MKNTTDKIVRALVTLLLIASPLGFWCAAIWWDRAHRRNDTPDLSGWGGLFVLGVIVLAVVAVRGFNHVKHNRNELGALELVIAAAGLALGGALLATKITWWSSIHVMWIVAGGIAFIAAIIWLAYSDPK